MKKLGTKHIFKNLVRFFVGISGVFFITTAFNITPIASNAIMFIKTIFLTQNGTNTSATGIILDGTTTGGITITNLTGASVIGTDGNGKLIKSTSGQVYDFISGFALSGPIGNTGPTGEQGNIGPQGNIGSQGPTGANGLLQAGVLGDTPYRNGSSWITTDANIFNTGGYVGIGINSPKADLQVIGTFIAGNASNKITVGNVESSIVGGTGNTIDGNYSIIVGGINNKISGSGSTVAGGYNTVTGTASIIGGGALNNIQANYSVIPGGYDNYISGNNSFAAGTSASALHEKTFIWNGKPKEAGLNETTATDNQFLIYTLHGVGINTNQTTGAALTVDGSIKATSTIQGLSFIATISSVGDSYSYDNGASFMNVPDYVFDRYFDANAITNPTYTFLKLNKVKDFVMENKHLPRVPSRAEINKDGGVNLQALIMVVLEKVEELYLYVFGIDDKIDILQKIVDQQQIQIQMLHNEIELLKK